VKPCTRSSDTKGHGLTLEGQVADLEALVGALLGRDDWRIADERVVDARVWDQVGLELIQIHIERTVESQTGRNGTDDLGNQTVQVLVVGAGDIQATAADVVYCLVVDEEGAVGVLNGAVGREDSVVGLHHGGGNARSWVHGKFELALLAVVGGQALEQERAKARSGSTTKRVEDEEALERRAVICSALARTAQRDLSQSRDYSPATRRILSMTLSTISLPIV
jgi:hypothetical protein